VARTQEDRKAETRGRLLDAAADLFAHKGFHAVSAEAVADAADRTTGALYSHFGNKEGLLLALLETWRAETVDAIEAELEAAPDVNSRLAALWAKFSAQPGDGVAGEGADDDAGRGEAWTLLEHELWLYAARAPEVADTLAARYADDRSKLGQGLTRFAAAEGRALARPVEQESVLALGLLVGLAMQHRIDPASVPAELVVEGLRRLLGLDATPS
jgi:AcrR family transcriptional regulator